MNNSIPELTSLIELILQVNTQNNLNIRLCLGHGLQSSYSERQQDDLICSKCNDNDDQTSNERVICAHCKDVRTESNKWIQIESFIKEVAGIYFSHGLCPNCYEIYSNF